MTTLTLRFFAQKINFIDMQFVMSHRIFIAVSYKFVYSAKNTSYSVLIIVLKCFKSESYFHTTYSDT